MKIEANRYLVYNSVPHKKGDIFEIAEADAPQFTDSGWGKLVPERVLKVPASLQRKTQTNQGGNE